MAHIHTHTHGHEHDTPGDIHAHGSATRNLGMAFFLNLGFAVIEIVGGILTNSISIISDAVHDFGDALSIGVSYGLEKFSEKKRDRIFTYGYKRFSTLAALINSLVLFGGSIFVFTQAIPRLIHPQEVHHEGMMWLAIAGVLINGLAALKLTRGKSVNQRAVMLHLLEDVLGWIAVLMGSIVIRYTGWFILDPILSIAIGLFILINVIRNLYAIFRIFLQAAPSNLDGDKVKAELEKLDGITDVHDLHVWTLDGENNIASVHLVVQDGLSPAKIGEIKIQAKTEAAKIGIDHLTVEIEFASEECHVCEELDS